MNVLDLFAKLSLDSSEYEQGLEGAKSKASSIGGVIGKGLSTAGKIAGVAIGAATTAVGVFAKSSLDAGMDFDKAMSQVQATMLKTNEEMTNSIGHSSTAFGEFEGNLREFAQFLGQNTAFSATEAAEALNYMALAGYSTQESMDMLPNVLSLAAAGNFDLARASDMVTDAQTAFGISAERTTQMVDEMAKAASTGNTSVEQLGDAFLVVGGLAKELNGGMVTLADGTQAPVDGLQEMEIALTAMANAGVKGSEAGTHMRNMLLKLSSPTDAGTQALEEMGVTVFDTEGKMRSLADIFGDLSDELDNMTQEQKIQTISDLFNTRDMASAEALLAAVGQDWDEIGASILDAKGSAAEMSKIQLNNLEGDITLFKSALEGAKIAISDQLTPSLREFVRFGTSGLSTLTDAFQKGGLSGAMEAFGTILSNGLNMIISKLPDFINAGMQLLGAFGQGILDNLPTIVDAAVQIVVMLVQGIVKALPQLAEGVVTLVQSLGQALYENQDSLIQAGKTLLDFIWNGLTTNLPQFLANAYAALPNVISKITEFIKGNGSDFIGAGIELISNLINGILESFPEVIRAMTELFIQMVFALTDPSNLAQIVVVAGNIIMTLANGILEALPQLLDAIPQIISNLVGALVASLPEILAVGVQLLVALITGIIQTIPRLVLAIPAIITVLVGGLVQGIQAIVDVGRDIVEGLWQGIKSRWDGLVEDFKGLASGLIDGVKGLFGIASPSKVFAEMGRYIDEGFAQGINAYSGLVDDAMDGITDIPDINAEANINGSGRNSSNMANNVIINVYGAQGQDEETLARKVANLVRDEVVSIGAT